MNKAFEKILERLKEQARPLGIGLCPDWKYIRDINAVKIVQEVAEEYNEKLVSIDDVGYMLDNIQMSGNETWMDYYRKALKGLCELSGKEYNGGWIPCSERLPQEAFGCFVTVMDCEPSTQNDFENILPYFVGYDGHRWNDADGEEIPFEVIAWQPLPEPYKGESE